MASSRSSPAAIRAGGQREWWRPPHIHLSLDAGEKRQLVTQIYFDDPLDPENAWKHGAIQEKDRLLGALSETERQALVCRLRAPDEADLRALAALGLPAPDPRDERPPRAGRFDPVV